jgi:hypothetical protein
MRQIRFPLIELHSGGFHMPCIVACLKIPNVHEEGHETRWLDEWLIIFIMKRTYVYNYPPAFENGVF